MNKHTKVVRSVSITLLLAYCMPCFVTAVEQELKALVSQLQQVHGQVETLQQGLRVLVGKIKGSPAVEDLPMQNSSTDSVVSDEQAEGKGVKKLHSAEAKEEEKKPLDSTLTSEPGASAEVADSKETAPKTIAEKMKKMGGVGFGVSLADLRLKKTATSVPVAEFEVTDVANKGESKQQTFVLPDKPVMKNLRRKPTPKKMEMGGEDEGGSSLVDESVSSVDLHGGDDVQSVPVQKTSEQQTLVAPDKPLMQKRKNPTVKKMSLDNEDKVADVDNTATSVVQVMPDSKLSEEEVVVDQLATSGDVASLMFTQEKVAASELAKDTAVSSVDGDWQSCEALAAAVFAAIKQKNFLPMLKHEGAELRVSDNRVVFSVDDASGWPFRTVEDLLNKKIIIQIAGSKLNIHTLTMYLDNMLLLNNNKFFGYGSTWWELRTSSEWKMMYKHPLYGYNNIEKSSDLQGASEVNFYCAWDPIMFRKSDEPAAIQADSDRTFMLNFIVGLVLAVNGIGQR